MGRIHHLDHRTIERTASRCESRDMNGDLSDLADAYPALGRATHLLHRRVGQTKGLGEK